MKENKKKKEIKKKKENINDICVTMIAIIAFMGLTIIVFSYYAEPNFIITNNNKITTNMILYDDCKSIEKGNYILLGMESINNTLDLCLVDWSDYTNPRIYTNISKDDINKDWLDKYCKIIISRREYVCSDIYNEYKVKVIK